MDNYIGFTLEFVKAELEKQKKVYTIIENNFNVDGDTTLVTNAKCQDGVIVLTVGRFIFDIERKQSIGESTTFAGN